MQKFEKAIEKLKDNTNSPLLKNLRKIMLEGFHEGLKSVDPEALIRDSVIITKIPDINDINLNIRGFNGTSTENIIFNLTEFQSVLIIHRIHYMLPFQDDRQSSMDQNARESQLDLHWEMGW